MSALTAARRAQYAQAKRRRLISWGVVLAVLAALPFVFQLNIFALAVMTQMGIAVIFALSYNMMLGQGGMLSFGHAVYFGMGGFLAMHFMNFIEEGVIPLPIPLLPLIGGLFGLLIAIIIGSFSTRRAGTVFAMISMGIAELVAASSLIFVAFFGGEEGISGDRTMGPNLLSFDYASEIEVYYIVAIWVAIAIYFMHRFSRTPAGRMANAVRDNSERAEFVGYSQRAVRWMSFCGAGFFAGVAGGSFAIAYEILTEETLNVVTSFGVLLWAYIGGIGFFIGPIVGAIFYTFLQTVMSNYTEIWVFYVAIIFLLTVSFVPAGLTGIMMMHLPAYQNGRLKLLFQPYALMAVLGLLFVFGVVGFLELGHFMKLTAATERETSLFFITMNVDSVVPWLAFAIMVGLGIFGMRRLMPGLMAAWTEANPTLGAAVKAAPEATIETVEDEAAVKEGAASP
ncbi:MAG TPA: branched-chain amino acid ABC transporter permease [Alphaproteobacteria bacterium]|jgi:branched-chain amino acid transport system permease protein|nr:branched-chain amino acid ABC transporter permease [Alphaproteobacteria bacterium]